MTLDTTPPDATEPIPDEAAARVPPDSAAPGEAIEGTLAAPPDTAPDDRRGARTGMVVAIVAIVAAFGIGAALLTPRSSRPTGEKRAATSSSLGGKAQPKVLFPDRDTPMPAPPFEVTTFDGERVTLDSLRGKPFVMNFWASWCIPCRKEMPALEAVAKATRGRVTVLGIATDDTSSAAKKFAEKAGVTYPVALDPGQVATDYGIFGLPSTYFVDSSGMIVDSWYGELTVDKFDERLRKLFPDAMAGVKKPKPPA